MSELRNIADAFDGMLAANKIAKYTYTLTQSEKQELNLEETEKISAGSWLGNIWNKIKSSGD